MLYKQAKQTGRVAMGWCYCLGTAPESEHGGVRSNDCVWRCLLERIHSLLQVSAPLSSSWCEHKGRFYCVKLEHQLQNLST